MLWLRKMIYERFDTEAAFARRIGWTRQRLHKILSKSKVPNITEIVEISSGLKEPIEKIIIFFADEVTKQAI